MPKLQDVLAKVGEAIGTVINWLSSNWGIISTIADVVLAIVAAFTAYNAVMKLVNAANALFAMNPIVLAIGAIIAIIVICVKHWDDIKAAAVKAWEGIKAAWGKVGDWFKGIVDKIKQAFANIGDWFKNLFSNAWNGIKNAWSGVKQWFSDLWNGIKNVYSAVGSWFSNIFTQAKTGIQNAFGTITGFFSGIWEKIKSIFANVGTAIANGIKGAVSTAVNKVLSTACKIINGFIGAINFAIDIINAIPGVNIGRLNTLSVPQMAKGGIVDSATLAVIGEQGKEAVVPLENNLQWLDKLAGMLNDRMGGNQPIVINVDGKRFGEIAVDTINGITRQRGSIPLVIA
jgi:phage-related protein